MLVPTADFSTYVSIKYTGERTRDVWTEELSPRVGLDLHYPQALRRQHRAAVYRKEMFRG